MRIGTLFSGIGAPEQGAKRVYDDLELVFACEFDKFARQSFEANYDIKPEHFHIDVNDMDGKQYKGKVDVIIGGSPCQDFSIAGLRAGIDGHRGQLIWQYYRIIMEAQPEIFIYENVKGMISDKNGKTIKDFLQIFRESGYFCHHAVLNTKEHGVPQNRERVYIVGFKDHDLYHRFQFADKIKLEKRLKDVLESEVDEKYYLGEKSVKYITDSQRLAKKFTSINGETSQTLMAQYSQSMAGTFLSVDCNGRVDSESTSTITARYHKGVEKFGGNPFIKIECMLNCKGTDQIRRVYGVDGIAATLTTMQGGNQEPKILQERIRKLTPRECLRLQDFPDTFMQVVSDSQQYKQAGNSMSVNILEMIFRQIEKAKSSEPTNTLMDFL